MSYYQSAETIYNQMIVNITNVDTSENSYIYNALFPSAMQISYALLCLDDAEKKVYASTAVTNGYSKYLENRASEMGITRKTATYAKIQVTFTGKVGTVISQGSIVSTSDNRLYSTISDATIGTDGTITCYVQADTMGTVYNVKANEINYLPVKYSGITSVTNVNAYNEAVDDESDADLYSRYLVRVRNASGSGCVSDYQTWALSVTGIGMALVLPLWNGNGTVKIVCANENKRACDDALITKVNTYITSVMPIGCTLTVESVTEVALNINFTLTYDTANTLETIQSNIETALTTYLGNIALDITSIKYNKILSIIMDVAGVTDISNLTINGGTANIPISNTQVGILGVLTIA